MILISITIVSLSAELNQLRIVGQAEKTSDIVPARYETVNRERAACIIFVTDLAVDLDFRPRIELVDYNQPAVGQYNVYVAPGERVIDVHASGYSPLIVVLRDFGIPTLRSGDAYRLQLTGERTEVRTIESININIQTNPHNATIYLNDELVEDNRQILARMGRNTLRIEHSGYKQIIDEIDVSEGRSFFEYELSLALDVPVIINTDPAGATVILDDIDIGITPLQFFHREGEYRLIIVIDNYAPMEEIIEIKEPQTVKSFRLKEIRGKGSLTIRTDNNSEVFINDEAFPHGVNNLRLPPQLINIRIMNPKAQDITRSIVIIEGEHQEIELYAQIFRGTIGVSVMPIDARVELTGDTGERFSTQGSHTFRDVPIGMYQLEIKADNYITQREWFELKKDEVVRKQLILEEGNDLAIQMVYVQGGVLQMGNPSGGHSDSNNRPLSRVTLSDFYISKHEVSQWQWQEIIGSNPSHFKGDSLPVESVSWYDAIEFCNKLSIIDDLTPIYSINGNTSPNDWSRGTIVANWNANGYRLPTEAEWEYAARGGNKSRDYTFSGSNRIGDVAWYDDNSGTKTHPIGTKRANELGIYDMSGNVWEWCWDWYGGYTASAKTEPKGPVNGSNRVVRGGGWYNDTDSLPTWNRSKVRPDFSFASLGFRIARTRL